MSKNAHIIAKQVVDVTVESGGDAFALQQEISRLLHERLVPALDDLFGRYVDADTFIRLDNLEVDVGRIDPASLEEDFVESVLEAVEQALARQLRAVPFKKISVRSRHTVELWLYFLERGHFPWWAPPVDHAEFEEAVLEALDDPDLADEAAGLLSRSSTSRRRLARQYGDGVLERLTARYVRLAGSSVLRVLEAYDVLSKQHAGWAGRRTVFRSRLWEALLEDAFAVKPAGAEPEIEPILRRAVREVIHVDAAAPGRGELRQSSSRAVSDDAATGRGAGGDSRPDSVEGVVRQLLERAGFKPSVDARRRGRGSTQTPPNADSRSRRATETPSKGFQSDGEGTAEKGEPGVERSRSTEPGRGGAESARADLHGEQQETSGDEMSGDETSAQDRSASPPDDPGPKADRQRIDEGEAIFVANAGLVLLHPYLVMLFERLGLAADGAFETFLDQEKAVHLLHYLATGEPSGPEELLVLNKLLCGLSPPDPVAREVELAESDREEADRMLESVIHHWKALKNTSPDGLREAFLQRDGKLTRGMDDWRLQVEQKSYDVLLGRLPWPLSLVRLPWMSEILHVEWA